jgi:hypothetical protein
VFEQIYPGVHYAQLDVPNSETYPVVQRVGDWDGLVQDFPYGHDVH